MGVQPGWNQTTIINTSRHQQLLANLARRGPGCWLIPKGKMNFGFHPALEHSGGQEQSTQQTAPAIKLGGGFVSVGGCVQGYTQQEQLFPA